MAKVADEAKSGLDPLFDPVFFYTDEQKELRQQLIEICERDIRPHADSNDRTSTFPRKGLEALGPFLGLLLPREWGGLAQGHVMFATAVETIARYGDPSCAMCYVMHIAAVEALRLCANPYQVETYLKKAA